MVGFFARLVMVLPWLAVATTAQAAASTAVPLQRPRAMGAARVAPPPSTAAPMAAEQQPIAEPVASEPIASKPIAATPIATETSDPTRAPRAAASPPAPRSTTTPGEIGLRKQATRPPTKFQHAGFTADLRLGALGCLRGLCSGAHNVRPGFRIDGFVGGNIRGFVDFGVAGGWGSMNADVAAGTNALSLYGLDPYLLQQALTVLGGGQAPSIDLTALTVTDSKLRTAQGGPLLRIHFIPRGRFMAYVGSGVQYNLFRARYGTAGGGAKIDFHGLAVPVEAGFGVHVHEHVAVGVQFDYLWTWYALANLDHGGQSVTVPVRILDEAARMQNTTLRGQLPQFWTFGLMLRARV